MYSILILDDDDHVLKSLSRLLRSSHYGLSCFKDPQEALIQCTTRSFDLILSDQRMPGMLGTEFFAEVAQIQPETRRILISGYSDFTSVTDAFNAGVIHKFVVKPWDNDQLRDFVAEQLIQKQKGNLGVAPPSKLTPLHISSHSENRHAFHGIVTSDPGMQQQLALIAKTADSEAPFFIHGETGTGKELIARAIHLESDRKNRPFVALNCANLTETLLESQLFGHKKGAFTGADKDQTGLLETAEGGTLFLDEVVEIPMASQAKLLRVLQEREYMPVGGTQPVPFDVKLISAAALSLEKAVQQGSFREDLRYRLEVMPINLPPLRARGDDRKDLFDYFLDNQLQRHGREAMDVAPAVYDCVLSYHWPGNVREMVNVCTYIAALAGDDDEVVTLKLLPPSIRQSAPPSQFASAVQGTSVTASNDQPLSKTVVSRQIDRDSLEQAITKYLGHRESIAQHFGISRMTLWRKLKQFDLN